MEIIKNYQQLIDNCGDGFHSGLKETRRRLLDAATAALTAADPVRIISQQLQRQGDYLAVSSAGQQSARFNLQDFENIYLIGGGKAALPMTKALVSLLGDRISAGVVNVPLDSISSQGHRNSADLPESIQLFQASHPLPSETGRRGAAAMLELAQRATANDLVICLISGGGSAMMALPPSGIPLADLVRLTSALLASGADITEINTVRRRISQIADGRLAAAAQPATVISLILSDVIGDDLSAVASGPTVFSPQTDQSSALKIINHYRLHSEISPRLYNYLTAPALRPDSLNPRFSSSNSSIYNFILAGNSRLRAAAANYLISNSTAEVLSLDSALNQSLDKVAAALIGAINLAGNSTTKRPLILIAGGEVTVELTSRGGGASGGGASGGRNQELMLNLVCHWDELDLLESTDEIVMLALASDGIDGPTEAAGAIVDSSTLIRARNAGLNPLEFLAGHDSGGFFRQLNDLIITGPSGTNLNDLFLISIG